MLVSHIPRETCPPRGEYFVRDVQFVSLLGLSSVATWHRDWTCASSLFNNGLDSMSRTRLFILKLDSRKYLVFTCNSFACILPLHSLCLARALTMWVLHVFESYYVYTFFFFLFFWLAVEAWTIFFTQWTSFHWCKSCLQQEVFCFRFLCFFLLWLINCLLHWCVCCGFLGYF